MSQFDSLIDTAVRGAYPKKPKWIAEHVTNVQNSIGAILPALPCSLEVAKVKAREGQGLARMGKKRWEEILKFTLQVGAARQDGDQLLPVLDAGDLDGVQVLSRQGVVFLAEAPEVGAEELGFYAGDEDLRLIALQDSRCFGSWAEGESACAACPLRGHCASATFDRLEALARDLDRQTEEALLAAVRDAEAPEVGNEVDEKLRGLAAARSTVASTSDEERSIQEVAAALGGSVIESAPFEANCFHCPDAIPAGSTSVIVRGKGACHEACARTLAQKEA